MSDGQMKNQEKRKRPVLVTILDIVLVVMALVFVISLFRMISEIRRVYTVDRYNSMESYLQEENYGAMASTYYFKNGGVREIAPEYLEYYKVAEYADAAFQERMAQLAGDAGEEAYYAEKKSTARKDMGSFAFLTEKIDARIAPIGETGE